MAGIAPTRARKSLRPSFRYALGARQRPCYTINIHLFSLPELLGATFALRVPSLKKGVAMAPHASVSTDLSLNLALAVIDSSTAPLLLLNGDDLTLIGLWIISLWHVIELPLRGKCALVMRRLAARNPSRTHFANLRSI